MAKPEGAMTGKKIVINQKTITPDNISVLHEFPGVADQLISFLKRWWDENEFIEFETSGSTGSPKKIKLPKKSMWQSARITNTYFGFTTGITSLVCMPVGFIAGAMMLVRAMQGEYAVYMVQPSSNPFVGLPDLKFAYTACTPMQAITAIETMASVRVFTSVGVVLIGGGEISSLAESKMKDLPNRIVATYGMTETITHIAVREISGPAHADHFTVLPEFSVSPDERGCLVIRAAHLPQPVVTNDLVELKNNGFKWIGRWDNVINSGGLKFSPEELEKSIQHLVNIPFVISSVSDKTLGNKLVLVVMSEMLPESEQDKLLKRVGVVLKGASKLHELHILGDFPVTATGKINRKQILSKLVKK